MGREGVAQGMNTSRLDDVGLAYGLFHGALQRVLRRMVTAPEPAIACSENPRP
jgi:hypothetical protein